MPDRSLQNFREIQHAFEENERVVWVRNFRTASILAFIFMPAGSTLDIAVYPAYFWEFFLFRWVCSAFLLFFWWFIKTPIGLRYYRVLGWIMPLLPTALIAYMIYATQGSNSPYYAGLNLVLLGAAIILRWTLLDSVIVFLEVLVLYLGACFLHGPIHSGGVFFNNIYFIFVTGVFVVFGSYFYNQLRFREFAFRYQLDKNKRELEATNRKLVEIDRLKSRFFANVSHEMRTPLTLLLSPMEALMDRLGHSLDARARESLTTMHSNAMRLLRLVNDLLDLVRLESGRMELKRDPIEVAGFVKGLASAVRQVAENKRVRLETFCDERLGVMLGDRDKLEKIAFNLLFNALKFTPEGGRVELRAERRNAPTLPAFRPPEGAARSTGEGKPAEEPGEEFVFIVSDTGIGIAEKDLPFVFDRFWQADSSSRRKHSGVGIGLALVKELTEIHSGRVTVQSRLGKGSTFTVHLPLHPADPSQKPKVEAPLPEPALDGGTPTEGWLANLYRRAELFPAVTALRQAVRPGAFSGRSGRPLVLIVDDEPDMRLFLKSQLEEEYDLVEAADGVEALEKARQLLPDIILLDMMMPEKDGLEVCRELREYPPTEAIPIIFLTARADEEIKFDALAAGANDFLAKPFSSSELYARVRNLIESHHHRHKLSKQNVALTSAIEQIKETEMQLVQSEKLASLGRLSAGIIHEINNPLNYSLTGLFALRAKSRQLPSEQRAEYEEILNDIEDGLKRVRNIVSDLRTFTHPGGGAGEPVEVADAVEASLRFLSGEWRGRIHISQSIPPNQTLWANRNKLIHVLVNLLQNAMDALQEKKFEDGDAPSVWIEGRTEGERSLIVVRDNGPGIGAKLLDKIFDPFFTTKEVGKGMGLGLSICYRIVQGYGGKISVKSEPGKFCQFTLDFPINEPPAKPETEHGEFLRL